MTELIEALVKETGLRTLDIKRIMLHAPEMYKAYEIDKRSGGKREIAQPTRAVKFVQRALVAILLDSLPVHECATAYRPGLSIRDNALPHAGDGPILKIDLKDFFPSIRAADWISYCVDNRLSMTKEEIFLTSRLLFYRKKGTRTLRLAVGAPSSPALSNVLMYLFDQNIIRNLENDRVTYTRYADDMTFSAPRTGYLNGVLKTVSTSLRELPYPRLSINRKKTTHVTRKYGRSVTGLTLANDGRVTIGRDNKRKIHAAVHSAKLGRSTQDQLQISAGMLAYVNAVEPEFLEILRKKYGDDVVVSIQKTVKRKQIPQAHEPPLARLTNTIVPDDD